MTAAEIYKEVISDLRLVIKIQSEVIQDLLKDRKNFIQFEEKKIDTDA